MTVAVALSGGGAKGAFQVGVLRYLSETGRLNALYSPQDPGILAGVSVGAINASFLAQGANKAQGASKIEDLTRIWTSLRGPRDLWIENFQIIGKDNPPAFPRNGDEEQRARGKKEAKQRIRDLLEPPPRALEDWGEKVKAKAGAAAKRTLGLSLLGPGGALLAGIGLLGAEHRIGENLEVHRSLFLLEPLRRMMEHGVSVVNDGVTVPLGPLHKNEVFSSPVDLILGMVGMASGRYYTWHKQRYLQNPGAEGDLFEAVLASAAMPVIFEPIRLRGEDMNDGGVRNVSPVADVYFRADEIYVIQCSSVAMPNVDIPDFKQVTDIILAEGLKRPAIKELFDEYIRGPRYRQPGDPVPKPDRAELKRFFDEVANDIRTRVPSLFESLFRALDFFTHEVLLNELMRIIMFNDALAVIQAHRARPGRPLDPAQEGVFANFNEPKTIHLLAPVETLYETQDVDPQLILANMAHGYNVAEHILDGKPLRPTVSLLGKNIPVRNKFGRDLVDGVTKHDPLELVRRLSEKEILGQVGREGFPDVGRRFIQTEFKGYSGGVPSSPTAYTGGVASGGRAQRTNAQAVDKPRPARKPHKQAVARRR